MPNMKLNSKIKADRTTGFGSETSTQGGRFISRDGHPNVTLQGASFLDTVSWYHTLLSISRVKFLVLVFAFYFLRLRHKVGLLLEKYLLTMVNYYKVSM